MPGFCGLRGSNCLGAPSFGQRDQALSRNIPRTQAFGKNHPAVISRTRLFFSARFLRLPEQQMQNLYFAVRLNALYPFVINRQQGENLS